MQNTTHLITHLIHFSSSCNELMENDEYNNNRGIYYIAFFYHSGRISRAQLLWSIHPWHNTIQSTVICILLIEEGENIKSGLRITLWFPGNQIFNPINITSSIDWIFGVVEGPLGMEYQFCSNYGGGGGVNKYSENHFYLSFEKGVELGMGWLLGVNSRHGNVWALLAPRVGGSLVQIFIESRDKCVSNFCSTLIILCDLYSHPPELKILTQERRNTKLW